jgi:tetratricopeptide (TPR) repeat protein
VKRGGRWWLTLALLLSAAGCGGDRELELRYEAERLRWKIDRAERMRAASGAVEDVAELRRLHEEVHRRFGANAPPTAEMLRNSDTVRRLRIAGASSLYGADLAADFHPSSETLAEYDRIASVYEFDRELGYRALYGQARLLEKLGRPSEALEVDRTLLARYPPVPAYKEGATLPALNPILLDLEIHTLALAKTLDPEKFTVQCAQTIPALGARAQEWKDTKLERELLVQLAHALFVAEQWDEGLAALSKARDLTAAKQEQMERDLEMSEILWRGKRNLAGAEEAALRTIDAGKGSSFEAEARMDLAKMFLEEKNFAAALEQLDEVLHLRPRFLEGLKGEVFYWKGMVLVGLEQWEDALPRLESVAEVDAEGDWAIQARMEIMKRVRALQLENGEQAARGAVDVAQRVRGSEDAREPPFGWEGYWWRPLQEERWQSCADDLREIARLFADSDFAATASAEADRLEKERIFHPVLEDSSTAVRPTSALQDSAAVKATSPKAEKDVARETS